MNSQTNTQNIAANDFSGVFNEAILFFAIFAFMSIVSFFISKRNAKKYELKHSVQERKEIRRKDKLIHKHLNPSGIKIMGKEVKDKELSIKLKLEVINEEEYKILKESLDSF
ncbi:MAG: hypothetical protein COB99_02210 [Sulfurimonas sp.]|nr:MAG: hypothetical protein COB99_02210 [Sulfurimonas sp.]